MATKTGGSANKYGAGGTLDGSFRKATREQKKSTGGTTAPRKIEEAHKEMRRMLTETRKQSASRTRKG